MNQNETIIVKVTYNYLQARFTDFGILKEGDVNRGYYMAARRYEISLRVLKNYLFT